uniref:Uncharacterized protein n=1 Tax=Anguilla anguilla TaxID=7936 RepID=A0A0E9V2I2_ANGAN
MTSMWEHRKT